MLTTNLTGNFGNHMSQLTTLRCVAEKLGDNGAKGGVYQSEDYFYDRREDIFEWYKIKEEYETKFASMLIDFGYILDENLCVINFRGGEYKNVANLILRKEYWLGAINHMLTINPNIKFLLITDDIECAKKYMPFEIPALHEEIGFDFYVINKAKYVILSNSSFGLWAAWLNKEVKLILAPKYWAKHNTSDGYWGVGDQYYRCFTYMDREGKLYSYNQCKEEAIKYYTLKNLI